MSWNDENHDVLADIKQWSDRLLNEPRTYRRTNIFPAFDNWPGGVAYDYECYLTETERIWTEEEKIQAYHNKTELPKLWIKRIHNWKDKEEKLWGLSEWVRPVGGEDPFLENRSYLL